MAETLDKGLALFAGLNPIPKRTTLSGFSVLGDPTFAGPLIHWWQDPAAELPGGIGPGKFIDLDFHTNFYHGHQALLQKHYVSKRSGRQRGVLTMLARDADTTIRKESAIDAVLRFVDYRKDPHPPARAGLRQPPHSAAC